MSKLKSSLILLLWLRLVPYSADNTHRKPLVCWLQPVPTPVLVIYIVFCLCCVLSMEFVSIQLHVFCSCQLLVSHSISLCISGTKTVTVFSRKFFKLFQVK